MKMGKRTYWMGGIVAAICSLSACTTDVERIPELHEEGVKAQFALSLPEEHRQSRMTADIVQVGEFTFRDLHNLRLYSMHTSSRVNGQLQVSAASTQMRAPLLLEQPKAADGHYNEGFAKDGINDIWYANVDIPINTNSFLMYAEAKPKEGDPSLSTNGGLVLAGGDDFTKMMFQRQSIIAGQDIKQHLTLQANKFLKLINGLLDVKGTVSTAADAKEVAWRYVRQEMHEGYYGLYQRFVSSTAGAAPNVLATLQGLYTQLVGMTEADGTLRTALLNYIQNYQEIQLTVSPTPTSTWDNGPYTLTYKSSEDLNFPSSYHLPDGSMVLTYTVIEGVGRFVYVQDGSNGVTPLNQFVYPASLYYRTNTPLLALNQFHENLGIQPNNWDELLAAYQQHGAQPSVTPVSRSILLTNPLQYGVAVLESHVDLAGENLLDNNPEGPQSIDVSQGFPLTGILVGRQTDVDWEFRPLSEDQLTSDDVYTVYDNVLVSKAGKVTSTSLKQLMAYTLLTESFGKSIHEGDDEQISVALEFKNTVADFYGVKKKLIPKDTKFYLIADLVLSKQAEKAGEKKLSKIFLQDHKTIANFKVTSLANAYNVIPDLRTPKLELGLAVVLTWDKGLDFDVDTDVPSEPVKP